MRVVGAILVALSLCGCHEFYKALHGSPPAFENHSAYDDAFFLHVWAETERLAGVDISLDGVATTIHGDVGSYCDACQDVDRIGCSTPTSIDIMGAVGTNAIEVGTETVHQLGHVYLSQINEGSDGRHAHAEWFGDGGIVQQAYELLKAGGIQ